MRNLNTPNRFLLLFLATTHPILAGWDPVESGLLPPQADARLSHLHNRWDEWRWRPAGSSAHNLQRLATVRARNCIGLLLSLRWLLLLSSFPRPLFLWCLADIFVVVAFVFCLCLSHEVLGHLQKHVLRSHEFVEVCCRSAVDRLYERLSEARIPLTVQALLARHGRHAVRTVVRFEL
jgi:hypothetical protein